MKSISKYQQIFFVENDDSKIYIEIQNIEKRTISIDKVRVLT